METKMLEAISSMLEGSSEPEVKCAKMMLDKIIEGRQAELPIMVPFPGVSRDYAVPPSCTSLPNKEEPMYLVDGEKGTLNKISVKYGEHGDLEEVQQDFFLKVDEVVCTYFQAKGKPFKKVTFI